MPSPSGRDAPPEVHSHSPTADAEFGYDAYTILSTVLFMPLGCVLCTYWVLRSPSRAPWSTTALIAIFASGVFLGVLFAWSPIQIHVAADDRAIACRYLLRPERTFQVATLRLETPTHRFLTGALSIRDDASGAWFLIWPDAFEGWAQLRSLVAA